MTPAISSALRSFVTTFVTVFVGTIPIASLLAGDWSWASAAVASALIAGLRTAVAALDPKQPLYGVGAYEPLTVDELVEDVAEPVEGD